MPVFGTTNFGSGGTPDGALTFTGKAGSSNDTTDYSISVACGDGGDMVVSAYAQDVYGGNPQTTTFTLDGQTITKKATQTDSSSECTISIGTCTGVSSGTNTCVVNWSASCFRCMIFVWKVENVDIVTMEQAIDVEAYNATMSAYKAGSVVIAATGTQSGTSFTGASGLTYNGNEQQESNAAGASALAADANTSFSFTTSISGERPVLVALELSKG
tara:strand:- start:652 stop:1299 length:648 start_codon:yes stop_codon:yes gene_type:complete